MDKTYNPKDFEREIYQNWTDKNYFAAIVNGGKTPFTVMMPPPNITGQLHIGHALDLSIQDAVIRYKRMKGFEALYMPGTDHASIATEVKIVEKLREEGTSKEQLGREEFLKRAFKWKDEYGGRIVNQQKSLGLSCDWRRLAFTMDENRSKAVKEVFVTLYNKGLIYRGDRIINWCPSCRTALSDSEVEYTDADSHLWHIKYPFADGSGFITVATTRPETMLGDTAVAVNPTDARYKTAVGKMLNLPLTKRQIPVIADTYVEAGFGSGAVKITPAHDPNDFEVGRRHNLPIIKVMDGGGIMNKEAGAFEGMPSDKARIRVAEELEKQGFLVKTENYKNSVGHCYRCDKTVEPLISKQWFVSMDKLAPPAIESVTSGKIKFIPKRFEKMYLHWMQNTRDWCISRQLWWGHRIPVYYCDGRDGCGKETASKTDITKCPHCGGEVRQDPDVLDTWFSSALWPFSTLGWPQQNADLSYFYPTSLLVTGYDIIGSWVSRMIFSGIEQMGEIPFSEVLIHGIVRDKDGKKMSKSSGNGVDPLEVIDTYGADVLRMSLVNGLSMGGDMKYSSDSLTGYRNFMNKIWNAARFVLLNCGDVKLVDIENHKRALSPADKWIIGRLNITAGQMTRLLDKYEIGLASSVIYEFIWNEFCDWYIEQSKVSLNSGDEDRRNLTQNVLLYVLREALKLAHPIIPFITAEIYNSLPNKDADDIMISPYPVFKRGMLKDAVKRMAEVMSAIRNIRNLRHEMNVNISRRTSVYIKPAIGKESFVRSTLKYIQKLGFADGVEVALAKPEGKMAVLASAIGEIYIPISQLVDTDTEINRLNKELENIALEIERAKGKLTNAGFIQKAPASLVAAEEEKLDKYKAQRELIIQSIDKLRNI